MIIHLEKTIQSDSKDLQITLYSIIYISGFICVGSFYEFQLYVFATNLVFVLMASVRINGN